MAGASTSGSGCSGPSLAQSAARLGLTKGQTLVLIAAVAGLAASLLFHRSATVAFIILAFQIGFLAVAIFRVLLIVMSRVQTPALPDPEEWPRYTVMAALYDEVEVVGQLIGRLARFDYPEDRIEAFILLEAHDAATIAAAERTPRPGWIRILVVPPGMPLTKPRALNHGLDHATGDLITIYDAEDDPDPLQLREAAARFAADRTGRLACLQAPLRIRCKNRSGIGAAFVERQFAIEYASLFEVTLPGMTRLGLPFPLGGTSNNFRTDVLRQLGGWDQWNVTEDADLGFRLWRNGWRQGVISRPTYEPPPSSLRVWLPQRTRWLKGFMQTFGVHTRNPAGLGVRGCFALAMTTGAAILAAAAHGLALAWVAAMVLVALAGGLPPATPMFAVGVLATGTLCAWAQAAIGTRRGGIPYGFIDAAASPIYWSLLSLAFMHAAVRLVREPFRWDKTQHSADHEAEAKPEAMPIRVGVAGRVAA